VGRFPSARQVRQAILDGADEITINTPTLGNIQVKRLNAYGALRRLEIPIYDSRTDPELWRFAGPDSNTPSTHWLLGSNGGTREILNGGVINISRRGGTSQGVDIRLRNLLQLRARENHAYRIEVVGRTARGHGSSMSIDATLGATGSGGGIRTLRNAGAWAAHNAPLDGFEARYTVTHGAILDYLAEGVERLRIGGARQQDLYIDRIVVTEISLSGIVYDLSMDSSIHRLHGHGSTTPGTHPLLTGTGNRIIVPCYYTTYINVTGRGGTSQGIDVRLADLNTRPNHRYVFLFEGYFMCSGTLSDMWVRTVSGTVQTLATNATPHSNHFKLIFSQTHEEIRSLLLTHPTQRFRLGGASQRDLHINGIRIVEICAPGCRLSGC
jgi:hypothetical protein